jgi:23S rRNA pseudouridine2457 synthase
VLIAFNKPFGVVCKFRREPGRRTLADYIEVSGVYPAGRLDTDSEGLLLLTDDEALQARIANPRHELAKVYWTQVEGAPTDAASLTIGSRITRRFRISGCDPSFDRAHFGHKPTSAFCRRNV